MVTLPSVWSKYSWTCTDNKDTHKSILVWANRLRCQFNRQRMSYTLLSLHSQFYRIPYACLFLHCRVPSLIGSRPSFKCTLSQKGDVQNKKLEDQINGKLLRAIIIVSQLAPWYIRFLLNLSKLQRHISLHLIMVPWCHCLLFPWLQLQLSVFQPYDSYMISLPVHVNGIRHNISNPLSLDENCFPKGKNYYTNFKHYY